MIDMQRSPEKTVPERTASLGPAETGFILTIRRELVVLAAAAAAFFLMLPLSAETNPEYKAAQSFLDDLSATAFSVGSGDLDAAEVASTRPGFRAATAPLEDGAIGTVVLGNHAGRCFAIHWQTPGISGPRAGVLDPALACDTTAELLGTLPAPQFIEVFPGTVPPLQADQLMTRVGEARHGAVEPFPAERTAAWFLPVAAGLVGVAAWHLAGVTLKAVRRRLSRG